MNHIATITKPILAAQALRSYLFWSARCSVLRLAVSTEAERAEAERQRAAFFQQYKLLSGVGIL